MKTINQYIVCLVILLLPAEILAQPSSNKNHIVKKVYTDGTGRFTRDIIQYFDGFGNPIETVIVGGSPTGQDIVTLTDYNIASGTTTEWLPAVINGSGAFTAPATVRTASIRTNGDNKPYAISQNELSPLQRHLKNTPHGEEWHNLGKAVRTEHYLNCNSCSEPNYQEGIYIDLGTLERSDSPLDIQLAIPPGTQGTLSIKVTAPYLFMFYSNFSNTYFNNSEYFDNITIVTNLDTGEETVYLWGGDDATRHQPGNYLITAYYNNTSPNVITEIPPITLYPTHPLDGVPTATSMGVTQANNNISFLWCDRYTISDSGIRNNGRYADGKLFVTKTTDEDGHVSYTFTDTKGQTVLSRQINDNEPYDTYYIYDELGNLCYVLPPELTKRLENLGATSFADTHPEMQVYAYIYKYDRYNRCNKKRLPGKDWEYFAYEFMGDRLVLYQDGMLRQKNGWKVMFYETFGRPNTTYYEFDQTMTHDEIQEYLNTWGLGTGWMHWETESILYDREYNYGIGFVEVAGVTSGYDNNPKMLKTYETQWTWDSDWGKRTEINRNYFYDYKARPVQIVEKNHLGGISRTSYKYDFLGNVLIKHESQQSSANGPVDILLTEYVYDRMDRLIQETATLNGQGKATVEYGYNQLGQLVKKTYGEGTTALNETYAYNVRGWLTDQNSTLFDMKLRYNNPQKLNTTASYSGNITEWEWQHKGTGTTGLVKNTYAFTYDGVGRLGNTLRYEGTSSTAVNKFVEQGLSYDRNGNIKTLQRYGPSVLEDNFSYTYAGNQLTSLRNGTTSHSYTYDKNGNMTKDGLNNVTLGYNYLNLVSEVKSGTTVKARYNWLADGTKLGVTDGAGTSGFEYLGSMVYTRSASGLALESAAFGDGRIYMTAAGPAGAPTTQSAPDGRQVQGVALINPTGEYPEDPYPDDPDNPGCPEVPIVPGDPWGPVVPWEPLDPDKPIDPTDPIAPIDPGGPDIPVGPITPLDPDPGIQIPDDPNMRRGGTYQTMYFIRDHLGSTRVVVNSSGIPQSRHDFYPFGMAHANPSLQAGTNRYLYNGKELQVTGGLKYLDYGARKYDPVTGRWITIDPLAELYYSYSPNAYVLNSPVRFFDLNGCSTHTDSLGHVIAIYNDGNLGVYKHNLNADSYDGSRLSWSDGSHMGETEYWDEFLPGFSPDGAGFIIQFGESFDGIIAEKHVLAQGMKLNQIASHSAGGGLFDIKKDYPGIGRILNGKYVTSRSAGNYLAGYNAAGGTYLGIGISFETFQKLAGALHIEESAGKRLTKAQMIDILLLGRYIGSAPHKFKAPAWGEIEYQYRMSKKGWYDKKK